MSSQMNDKSTAALDEETIAEYLKTHPDFFLRHESLLENLRVPHQAGGAISLIEKQVSLLRLQKKQMEEQLNGLIQAARNNEQIIGHLQRFTLEIIHTHGINDVLTVCEEHLNNHFKADFIGIRILVGDGNSAHFLKGNNGEMRSFTQLFKNRKPICGRITEKQSEIMFGDDKDAVESAVLIPLQNTQNLGVIALGSIDQSRFHPGMGTLFLTYMGDLITASISRHLEQ